LLAQATAADMKVQLELGNVNNTADAAKPVSTAQQTALDAKLAIASNLSDRGQRGDGADEPWALKSGADVQGYDASHWRPSPGWQPPPASWRIRRAWIRLGRSGHHH
jgi:hypothetical protein